MPNIVPCCHQSIAISRLKLRYTDDTVAASAAFDCGLLTENRIQLGQGKLTEVSLRTDELEQLFEIGLQWINFKINVPKCSHTESSGFLYQ